MLRRCRCAIFIVLLTLKGPSVAVEVDIGGTTIQLPAPKGFIEVTALHPPSREIAQAITPPNNRLLAIYLHQTDLDAINVGNDATWRRYMMVQTDRQTENFEISDADFIEFRAILKNQQDVLLDKVKDQVDGYFESINTGADPHSKIKVGYLLPLGVFADENRRLASESLSKYRRGNQRDDEGFLVSGATNVLHVEKHIVFAYVYSSYDDENDRRWVRQASDQWSADILTQNPPSLSILRRLQRFDWYQASNIALLGTIIGVGVGAFIFISRRRRR